MDVLIITRLYAYNETCLVHNADWTYTRQFSSLAEAQKFCQGKQA